MAGAPSQTPLGSLQCSPDPLLDLKGLLLRRGTGGEGKCREVKGGREGRTRKGRRREGRGAKRKGRVGCGAHKAAGARVPALAKVQAICHGVVADAVCQSRLCIVWKWLNISADLFWRLVAPPFQLLCTKYCGEIPMGPPLTGALNAGEV